MHRTIEHRVIDYGYDLDSKRWTLMLDAINSHQKLKLPAGLIAKNEDLLQSFSIQDLKIVYFLDILERWNMNPKIAAHLVDILFWRKGREDGLQLSDDRATWPVTSCYKKNLYQIIKQDYFSYCCCNVTFRYIGSQHLVTIAAQYVIGDDDFLAKLALEDIKCLVAIVASELPTNTVFPI